MRDFFRKNLFLLVGVLCICICGFSVYTHFNDKKVCTESADAVVIELEEHESTDSKGRRTTTYYAIVEYNANGKKIHTTSKSNVDEKEVTIGSTQKIKYDPANPEYFIIDGDNRLIFIGIGEGVLGIVFIFYDLKKRRAIAAEE